jgi:hypothetical protein
MLYLHEDVRLSGPIQLYRGIFSGGFPCRKASSIRWGACKGSFNVTLHCGFQELLDLYEEERYILVWRAGQAHVALRQDASSVDVLRCVWQVGHAG